MKRPRYLIEYLSYEEMEIEGKREKADQLHIYTPFRTQTHEQGITNHGRITVVKKKEYSNRNGLITDLFSRWSRRHSARGLRCLGHLLRFRLRDDAYESHPAHHAAAAEAHHVSAVGRDDE